ncbi:MAG: LPS-assembly protein LptD [Opitutaceae bacterium]|nr:LPS-assembly protein LptD [Opitutaceae bacterium]
MKACPRRRAIDGRPHRHRKEESKPYRWELACPAGGAFAAPTVIFRLLTAALACLAPGPSLRAQPQPRATADHQEFDMVSNTNQLSGNAQMDYGDARLRADTIVTNATNRTATARGHAELTRGPLRLLADVIVYRFADGSYTAERLRLGEYPLYLSGQAATGNRDTITVNDATVVLRDATPLAPTLAAAKIVYAPGKILQAEHAYLGVGSTLHFLVPKLGQNLEEPLLSHATLAGGYNSSLGANLTAGLHLPVSSGLKLGGDLGVYTARGVMFGPSGSYTSPESPAALRGSFRSGFIQDHGERKTDVLGRPVPEARGYVAWTHQQQLTDHLTLNAQLNYWKDSEILRDFQPEAFFRVQEPETAVESVYTGPNYFLSLFARFQPNKFQTVQQRLPELRFDLLPLAIGNGFYQQFTAGAAVLRDDPPLGGLRRSRNRLDAYSALIRPFAPREWLSFAPVAGGRLTHYANPSGAPGVGTYTRMLGEVGFDAELRSSATFNYKNEQWKIDGLRHLLTPRLSYRYLPEGDRGRREIPDIDRNVFSTYLPPLGLGVTRNIDDLHAYNTLRLGLDNTLQTRDPNYGSRDLLVVNAAADLRFHRQPGERDVSEVHAEVALTPVRWLQFDLYQSFAPQSLTLHQLNAGLALRDGDVWSLRFANHFLRRDTEEYAVEGSVRLNEVLEVVGRLHYDARKRLLVEQFYGLRQNLANTWRVDYALTLYDGPRREGDFGVRVQVELLRF